MLTPEEEPFVCENCKAGDHEGCLMGKCQCFIDEAKEQGIGYE